MERPMVSVAIVGGGVTGLAAAYYLEQVARQEGWNLTGVLVEQETRLGGKLLTLEEEGFLVEGGPDSFLTQKPWALEMVKDLGIEDDLISPQAHGVSLLHRGRLHSIPEGLGGAVPTRPWALWKASFLSLKGKVRASLEPFVRPRTPGEDESLGSFLRRRLGTEVAQRLAEPFVAGNHAGDAQQLSLRALYPALAEVEERYGSLTRWMRASRTPPGSRPSSPFRSLGKGMAFLPQAIASSLKGFTLLSGRGVTGLTWSKEAERPLFRLSVEGGDSVAADCVILTIPARGAAALVRPVAPEAAPLLEQLPFVSTASVSMAFRREAVMHPLNGNGFLVPRAEPGPVTACTWSSSKWPGRAPKGWVLLRAFVGWAKDDSFMKQDDAAIVRLVTEALRHLLGLQGDSGRAWVHRWPHAMPQYQVGHLAWLEALEQALAGCPGLYLAGASYRGVGVPDCIRQAKETVQSIRTLVSQRAIGSLEGSHPLEREPSLKKTLGR